MTPRSHRRDHTGIIIMQGWSRKCINYGVYPANTAWREQFRSEEQPNKIVLMVVMSWLCKWRTIRWSKSQQKCVESKGDIDLSLVCHKCGSFLILSVTISTPLKLVGRHVTYATQKKREKIKAVKACVSSQTVQKSPKWHPLSHHMANLQIPQPDSSMSSPSKSPMRVFEPEPALTGFWARRPYTDTGFPGPGPCLSPESGQSSSYNLVGGETAAQLFWQRNRYTPEHTPVPSPRMTSPGPSSRIQSGPVSPLHPWAGGSNMDSSANWPGDAINGKQQTHRLPLPPLAMSITGPSTPWYTTRTTPVVPKSPGRTDILASHGSGWKKGRLLGGTFGHVYLGFNSERGEMCAIKEVTLFSDDSRSKESAKQLRQEISLLSRLRHPNIVQYYGSKPRMTKFVYTWNMLLAVRFLNFFRNMASLEKWQSKVILVRSCPDWCICIQQIQSTGT